MKTLCAEMRKRIPIALLGELSAAEQIELETHLLNCSVCAAENAGFTETFAHLRSLSDISAPRHFMVYPGDAPLASFLKDAFWALKLRWKLAFGVGLTSLVLLILLFLTKFQFRAEHGVYSLSFGKPVPEGSVILRNQEDELKTQWMELLDARSRQDRQELNALFKQELANYSRGLSAHQKKEWQSAMSHLEGRLTKQIDGTTVALQNGMRQSVFELYQTVQSQRLQDMNRTRKQLDRLAYQENQKDQETKEILATLLQVTDMKPK